MLTILAKWFPSFYSFFNMRDGFFDGILTIEPRRDPRNVGPHRGG